MKTQTIKMLFTFLISVIMFSVMPALVNAQKKCLAGNCPKGSACVNGYCVKSGGGGNGGGNGGTWCNCQVRPIPFACGQSCGWRPTITKVYYTGSHPSSISFSLPRAEKISVKILDMTGRLMKTLADKFFEQGEHTLQWDAAGVNAGIYMIQINTGTYSDTKKIAVLK